MANQIFGNDRLRSYPVLKISTPFTGIMAVLYFPLPPHGSSHRLSNCIGRWVDGYVICGEPLRVTIRTLMGRFWGSFEDTAMELDAWDTGFLPVGSRFCED